MRSISLIIALLFLPFASLTALAENAPGPVIEPQRPPALSIEEDQAAKTFRFMIDGQEVARLNAAGLHVRDSIEYGGSITDTGGKVPANTPDEGAP